MFSLKKQKIKKEIEGLHNHSLITQEFFKAIYKDIDNNSNLFRWQKRKRRKKIEKLEIANALQAGNKVRELKDKLKNK